MRNLLFTLVILLVYSCSSRDVAMVDNTQLLIDQRVDSVLALMTLEEKIGQMNQYTGFWDLTGPAPDQGSQKDKYEHLRLGYVGSMLNVVGNENVRRLQEIAVNETRLGIPLIFGLDVIHGHKTLFPIPLGESASWDLELIKKSARIAAIESSARGVNWTFAPMVDISRDPRWGRVMEGAGEDPFLGAQIGVARIQGFQGEDLSLNNTIAACAKHFAGYGFAEAGKDYNSVEIGESTLYNIVFPPFRAAVEQGDVKTFMNSFNTLNGIPATGNKFLQRDILKGEWNFQGFVVSDWASAKEMIDHGFAENLEEAAKIAANAGSDMDMESYGYIGHLKQLVLDNKVRMSHIDDAVRRILKVKFELGLFDDPFKYCSKSREDSLLYAKDHLEAALEVAKNSIVLLKNEGSILPLSKTAKNIALIGPLADDKNSPLGNWRMESDDNSAVSVLEGVKKYIADVKYAKGVDFVLNQVAFPTELVVNQSDRSKFDEAIKLAAKSDVVLMVLGEYSHHSGEARSRSELGLPGLQQELLEKIYQVNKNVVLILMNGRPLTIGWADENIPAILETWHLGTRSGDAIAEVLFGDCNPSGKLPMTFPRSVGQIPIYYNHLNSGRPGPKDEVFWGHYMDQSNEPLYPFGFGLSYSKFEYSNLTAIQNGENIDVSVEVENTGNFDGKEVVQLYIRDVFASVARPVKELKGFKKLLINRSQKVKVEFTLRAAELGFYNNNGNFVVEKGKFEIMVGGNSKDLLKTAIDYN